MALELHGHIEHGLLQQAAAGTQLVGVDGFVLQAQGHIEDLHVLGGVAHGALCQGFAAAQHGHGHSGQGGARAQELTARGGLTDEVHGGVLMK